MTDLKESYPYYLANEAVYANQDLKVYDKYTGEIATHVAMATPDTIDAAITAAVAATEPMEEMASYQKQDVVNHRVTRFKERFDELAYTLCVEAGKPINDGEGGSHAADRHVSNCG